MKNVKPTLLQEKFAKLIELKSIITILFIALVVFVVVIQTVRGKFELSPETVVGMVMCTLTYFFTRQKTTST